MDIDLFTIPFAAIHVLSLDTIVAFTLGLLTAPIVWACRFYLLRPRIHLSSAISRIVAGTPPGSYRYRVKIANYAFRSALDLQVECVARISDLPNYPNGTAIIKVGISSGLIPILKGRHLASRAQFLCPRHRLLYVNPNDLTEFAMQRLPSPLDAQLGRGEPITLEELLTAGSTSSKPDSESTAPRSSLSVIVSCTDAYSGARRAVVRPYALSDIRNTPFKKRRLDVS